MKKARKKSTRKSTRTRKSIPSVVVISCGTHKGGKHKKKGRK
ncbi:MAG: hypothetical protein QW474_00120 [Candidatus Aenigmatarchaeota archaeon]